MSLVADYSDSDDNSDPEGLGNGGPVGNGNGSSNKKRELINSTIASSDLEPEREEMKRSQSLGKDRNNFLLPEASGSSGSESDDDSSLKHKKRKQQSRIQLDNPFRTFGDVNVAKEDSVFRNPFRDKEDERIAVLEHHVKMTENPETALTINGKKICWNYRKRKCYLGTQCPYAHDSDVPLTEEQLKEQKLENDLHRSAAGSATMGQKLAFNVTSATPSHLPGTASVVAGGYDSSAFYTSSHLSGGSEKHKPNDFEDDDQPYKNKCKKRVGLSKGVIPSKKAFNLYLKTKDK